MNWTEPQRPRADRFIGPMAAIRNLQNQLKDVKYYADQAVETGDYQGAIQRIRSVLG